MNNLFLCSNSHESKVKEAMGYSYHIPERCGKELRRDNFDEHGDRDRKTHTRMERDIGMEEGIGEGKAKK